MVENDVPHQPKLPLEPESEKRVLDEELTETDGKVTAGLGHIVLDDTERGGISERERLGLVTDEDGRVIEDDFVSDPVAYASALLEKMGPRTVELYNQFKRSPYPDKRRVAEALESSDRFQGLIKEQFRR